MKHLKLIILTLITTLSLSGLAGALSLQWDANPAADKVTNYKVYEHVGTSYNLQATVGPSITTYVLPSPLPAGSHAYAITALNLGGESPKSNDVVAANTPTPTPTPPPPSAPTGLKIVP